MKTDLTNTLSEENGFVENGQEECVTPVAFLSCGVKGQIGIQLSMERLNPVTTVTFCTPRMTKVKERPLSLV